MSQNLSSAAVVIGALNVKLSFNIDQGPCFLVLQYHQLLRYLLTWILYINIGSVLSILQYQKRYEFDLDLWPQF